MGELLSSVLLNSFWIVGLALLLAALSYHADQAHRLQRPLREQLSARSFAVSAWVAMTLIGAGLAGTSAQWWEVVVWALFALFALFNAINAWRSEGHRALDDMPEHSR